MLITVQRIKFTPLSTIGILAVDGDDSWVTLELPYGDGLPGSCIPNGTYPVSVYPSPRFGRPMPLIMGIPNRSQIEMHWGNYPRDTDGCILVGMAAEQDMISDSREAFDNFWATIQAPLERGKVTIEIAGQPSGEAQ
jgi:hypothetical protein